MSVVSRRSCDAIICDGMPSRPKNNNVVSQPAASRPGTLAIAAGLVVAVIVLFGRSAGFDFCNYDDPDYVIDNEHVRSGLTAESVRWAFTSTEYANWFPLLWLSLELDYQLWGTNSVGQLSAAGFHAINVVLHLANTLLLFWLLRSATGELNASGCVAALFAVHPLHVESVVWVTERKDVLSTLFWMLTLLAYVRYAARPSMLRYSLVAVLLALGLMAKQMLVTLPCVMLLFDYWPLRRWGWPQASPPTGAATAPGFSPATAPWLIGEKLPLLALSAAAGLVTVWVQATGGALSPVDRLPLVYRLMSVPVAYLAYLVKTAWPAHLAVFYPHTQQVQLPWLTAIAATLLAAITYAAVRARRSSPWFVVGWLWYLGTLVPVIGLVQVGRQGIADRYTYIPLIGIFLAVVWWVKSLAASGRLSSRLSVLLAMSALVSFAACTWVQVGYWRDSVTLWQHALEVSGHNAQVLDGLGQALSHSNRDREAIPYLRELTRLMPDYETAHVNLAVALLKLEQFDDGRRELEESLRINPRSAAAHFNLGRLDYLQGKPDSGLSHLRQSVRHNPKSYEAHMMLYGILNEQGKRQEAAEHLKAAQKSAPAATTSLPVAK